MLFRVGGTDGVRAKTFPCEKFRPLRGIYFLRKLANQPNLSLYIWEKLGRFVQFMLQIEDSASEGIP